MGASTDRRTTLGGRRAMSSDGGRSHSLLRRYCKRISGGPMHCTPQTNHPSFDFQPNDESNLSQQHGESTLTRQCFQPPHLQRKWSMLALQNQPLANKSVAELLGPPWQRLNDNPKKPGQYFSFMSGYLISLDSNPEPPPMQVAQHSFPPPTNPALPGYLPPGAKSPYGSPPVQSGPPMYQLPQQSPSFPGGSKRPNTTPIELIPPFAVYGTICEFYKKERGIEGKYGRPLADEQDLGDGGRCSIFEGGHIHIVAWHRGLLLKLAQHRTSPVPHLRLLRSTPLTPIMQLSLVCITSRTGDPLAHNITSRTGDLPVHNITSPTIP